MAFTDGRRRPPQLGVLTEAAAAVEVGRKAIGTLGTVFHSGSTAPYPYVNDPHNNATDAARAARADAYLVAALYGSVLAARYALGARQSSGAATEQKLYDVVLSSIQRLAPQIASAAQTAGLLNDAGDGRGGLEELWRMQIPFRDPWAGHNSGDHSVLDAATVDLANKLAALSAVGVTALPQPGQLATIPAGSPFSTGATAGAAAGGAIGGTPGVGVGAGGAGGVGGGGITQAGLAGGGSAFFPLILAAALAYALTRKR